MKHSLCTVIALLLLCGSSLWAQEKPLPEVFRKIDPSRIRRAVPRNRTRQNSFSQVPKQVTDPGAPFGYAASIDSPDLPFHFGYHAMQGGAPSVRGELNKWDIIPETYQIFRLGTIQLVPHRAYLWFGKSWGTYCDLAALYDAKEPKAEYECWVSLKFPKNFKASRTDLVLCDQIILVKKSSDSAGLAKIADNIVDVSRL